MRLLIGGSIAVAAVSLLLPAMPGADPWAWIVWGREVTELDLDTTQGPSWKPLPVFFTTLFAPFGDAAPDLWLLVARTGGIMALGLAFLVAERLAGAVPKRRSVETSRPGNIFAGQSSERLMSLAGVAGGVAVLGLLFLPDWLKYMAQGSSEPLVLALLMGAILCHLDGRPRLALLWAFLICLARPEAWPFAAAYGFLIVRRDSGLRLPVSIGAGLVLVLWFVPDWIGSGDPLYGARRARARSATGDGSEETLDRALDALGELVLLPLFVLAVWALVRAWRQRERVALVLGCLSVPWILGVVVMAGLGYAGNSRYMVPAAAVTCVLAGVGAVRALAAVTRPLVRWGLVALMVLVSAPFAIPRIEEAQDQADRSRLEDRLDDDLPEAIRVGGGRDEILRAGQGAVVVNGWPAAPGMDRPIAWRLDLHLSDVDLLRGGGARSLRPLRHDAVLFSPLHRAPTHGLARFSIEPLARTDDWDVVAVRSRGP